MSESSLVNVRRRGRRLNSAPDLHKPRVKGRDKAMGTLSGARVMSKLSTHDDLRGTLAHHDAAINQLSTRVSHVETAIETGFAKASDNFNELKSMLAKTEGQKGPGLGEIMKVVATGGAIVGMSAAAITMLVTSFVAPELTNLKDTATVLSKDHDARMDREREELAALREKRKIEVESRLDELMKSMEAIKERFGWVARVEKQR